MASRLAGGSLSKYCKPGCGTAAPSELDEESFPAHPAQVEMHSPQFSLKSYQMNGRTPPRQDLIGESENQFDPVEASPKALRSLHKSFADAGPGNGEGEAKVDDGESGYKVYTSEWVAQVEPGVYITFSTASDGLNDLKRIKFRWVTWPQPSSLDDWS